MAMKYISLSLCLICLFMACRPAYTCNCYSNHNIDTTFDFGQISSDDAHKRCDVIQSSHSKDSCGIYGIGMH